MNDLVKRLRSFETDHKPHGWPPIQMRDVSAFLDRIEALERDLAQAVAALEIIAAQHSGEVCGTSRSDCMAAIARASLGTIDLSLLAN